MSYEYDTNVQWLKARVDYLEHELAKVNLQLQLAILANNKEEIAEQRLEMENVTRKYNWFINALQNKTTDKTA